jgi:Concanavalin A-like lectin/glucanases superfamily
MPRSQVARRSLFSAVGAFLACFCALAGGFGVAVASASQAPIAAYSFDEGEGSTVEDLTGDGHTATIEGADWSTRGKYGGAMEFNREAHDFLKVPAAEDLDETEELTVEAWVRPSETSYLAEIVMKEREGSGAKYSWTLDQQGAEAKEAAGYFMQTEEGMLAGGEGSLPLNTWTHLAITDDGAHNRLYVNGELVDTAAAIAFDGHGDIRIGGNAVFGQWFDGRIDEVRIYDRALSEAELQSDRISPIQTPQKDPVAAYSFDEGEGEVAHDAWGEHDGTIEGAEWARGKFGSSLKFDGEDMVTIPASEDLNLTEEFTLEAWIKPETEGEYGHLFVKEDAAEEQTAYVISKHESRFHARLGIPGVEEESPTDALELGSWQHIAATYDGGRVRFYVNGELVGNAPVADILSTDGALRIGDADLWWSDEGFKGRIDEVRIYDRALSDAEVQADSAAPIQTPQKSPIAAYSFDAGEGSTLEDVTGNEHDGTIEGPEWTDRGKYGNALSFNGESEDCVTVPDESGALQLTEELTLEAWVKPSGPTENDPIIFKEALGIGGQPGYAMGIGVTSSGKPEGVIGEEGESENVEAPGKIDSNVWTHLAFTYDGAHMRLYVNGSLVATQAQADAPLAAPGDLKIGCSAWWWEEGFDGRIDEVRIYDRALSAGEIGGDMNVGTQSSSRTPIAAYSFDAGEGSTLEDVTGNEHDGTIEGPEWTDRGKYGNALSFNGESEDCVTVPDESGALQLTEELTLEAWVKPSGPTENDPIIFKEALGIGGQPGYAMGIGVTSSGKPEGVIGEEGESENVEAPGKIDSNVWTHLAFTYDGAHMRLYVNGSLVATQAQADAPLAAPGDLKIGCSAWWWEEGFDGRIDEVRIYDRALSAGEIGGDSATPIQTPQKTPVAAYSFDAGEGETAEDITGNEHEGTIEGPEWTDRGKYGSALQFNGEEGECVTIPDAEDLRTTEELTLEAWVKPTSPVNDDPILYKSSWGYTGSALGIGIWSEGKPEGLIGEGEGEFENVVGPKAIEGNVWTHLAFTYDGAHMRLYVNGELVATQAQGEGPPWGEGDLVIGCNPNYSPEVFDGKIDEVRIYDRALGETELRQAMRAPLPLATTEAATDLGANDAVLNGTVKSNEPETEYYFEYGQTPAYGHSVTGEELGREPEKLEINQAIIHLSPETTYHYRLVADSLNGISYGKDLVLVTGNRALTTEEEAEIDEAEQRSELTPKAKEAGPGDFYGMMWTGDLVGMLNTNDFQTTEESGAKWIKLPVGIGFPEKQIIDAFEEADAHHLTILPGMGGGPFPRPETTLRKEWLDYAAETVKRYGPNSSYGIKTWEIWNEPNMPHPITFEDGEAPKQREEKAKLKSESIEKVNPNAFAGFFEEMAAVMRAAATEGENKEGIEILAPGLFGYRSPGCNPECHLKPRRFMTEMNAQLKGSPTSVYDALNLHPYVFKIGEHNKQHRPEKHDIVQLVEAIHQSIVELHDIRKDQPIWITELGFPVANLKNPKKFPPVTPLVQRLAVNASFSMMQSNRVLLNIPHAFYYNLQDIQEPGWDYHSGLLDLSNKKRPAWTAYKCLADGKPC